MFDFGDYDTGGYISQDVSTDYTGCVIGDVTRQVMGQTGSAYVAISDAGFAWDPEHPNTATTLQIGITKDQFAAASTAIVPEIIPVTTKDINGDTYEEDWYLGKHDVTYLTQEDAGWSATFSDSANAGTNTESAIPVRLYQENYGSTVTVSADTYFDNNDVFQIVGDGCNGEGDIWQGYTDASLTDPYSNMNKLVPNDPTVPDIEALLSYADIGGSAQLTEVGATSHSDVSLTQTTYNMANGPFAVNSLNGAATLGGAFENAFVDADVPVTISMNSNGFNFWWDQGLMPP
jgi:hypothetical protein